MAFVQMTALEFYNTKRNLSPGSYEVLEHDGEVNVVTLDAYGSEKWYSQSEFEEFEQESIRQEMIDNDGYSFEEEYYID